MHIKHSLYKCMTLRIHVISYLLFNVFWWLHSNFATGRSQFNWKHGMELKYKMGCHLESNTWLLQHATDKQCGSSAMGWAPNRNLTSQCQILHPKHVAKAHYQIPNQHVVWARTGIQLRNWLLHELSMCNMPKGFPIKSKTWFAALACHPYRQTQTDR